MNLRSVEPGLQSLRRLRIFICAQGSPGKHGSRRRHPGAGLGEGTQARKAALSLFRNFRVFGTCGDNVKLAVRMLFPRFLAATWVAVLRAHARRTPPALQRTYVYFYCGFRNIKLQERRNTGTRREIQGRKRNTGKKSNTGREKWQYRKKESNTGRHKRNTGERRGRS